MQALKKISGHALAVHIYPPQCLYGNRDTQQHIVTCPGYSSLRDGRNLNCESDLVNYFRDVLKVRSSGAN